AGPARPVALPGSLRRRARGDQPRRTDRRCHLRGGRGPVLNVLDYAGPNLASNQLIVYTPNGPHGPGGPGNGPRGPGTGSKLQSMAASARGIATALGSHDVLQLDSTSASLHHAGAGRNWNGPVYVATPQLLRAFGIQASQIKPTADILTMRPGLTGISH